MNRFIILFLILPFINQGFAQETKIVNLTSAQFHEKISNEEGTLLDVYNTPHILDSKLS
jgi:hypothetical protein